MFIKIMAISSILILGSLIFAPEIIGMFSNVSSNVESMKDNVNNFGIKTAETVENGIDSSAKVVDETNDKISNQIDIAKKSSKELTEKISDINPIKSVDVVFKNETSDQPISEIIPTNIDSPSIEFSYSKSLIYENLSLSMIQQSNGDILLQYSDITGNTKSTKVVIRTDEREIFSGTFFTSNFKTVVNDISRTSYYVDIVVDHKDYGTVTSSIFNSGDNVDSEIAGDFIQS